MVEVKKGTFKRSVCTLEVKNFEVSNIIVIALLDKGFDVTSEVLFDGQMMQIGEKLSIAKIENGIGGY